MLAEQHNSQHACPRCLALEAALRQMANRLQQLEERYSRIQEENGRIQEENSRIQEECSRLEEELTKARRAGKRLLSVARKRRRIPSDPGGRLGIPGSNRPWPKDIDQTLNAPVRIAAVPAWRDLKREENFQTDLPPVRSKVTRLISRAVLKE